MSQKTTNLSGRGKGVDGRVGFGQHSSMKTAVYVVSWSKRGPSKIGVASNPVARLSGLQTSHPYRLTLHFAAMVPDKDAALVIENRVLVDFGDLRLLGEWARVAPAQAVSAIKQACKELKVPYEAWRPTEAQQEARAKQLTIVPNRFAREHAAISEWEYLRNC